MPARRRGQDAGAAQIGDVVAGGGGAALAGEVGGEAEHVEFGGHAEAQGAGEVAVEDVDVGVDESGEERAALAVGDEVGRRERSRR
ncbi:hypothetical protein AB0I28_29250 [Phytomonospora sp. NPDC050363]|uniref:hypothetical protein n=1 Tax=Phytomonospora sp. NPDC050363 TaxID=3155642 RepID=UPI0033FE3BDE